MRILLSFGAISLNYSVLLLVHLISLNKKHGFKCFRDLFENKHAEFVYSDVFPSPYIEISEIGIRSGWYKI